MLKKLLPGLVPLILATNIYCEEINIIPTPKEMKILSGKTPIDEANTIIVLGKNADRKSSIGAEEINRKLVEMNLKALSVVNEDTDLKNKNLIIIGTPEENGLVKKYLAQRKESIPDKKQGYTISQSIEKSQTIYILGGKDAIGTLYACESFKKLILKEANGIYVLNVFIKDWPDCLKRAVLIASDFNQGHKKFLKYLDWMLEHKNNFAGIDLWNSNNGHYTVPNKTEAIQAMKKFNEYASERGIETTAHAFYWNIGYIPEDKGKPEFKGCVESGKGYWCLSRDKLIEKKAEEIGKFLKESGFKNVLLHARDGSPTAYWSERCSECRKRFGDDRAGADANFINIMSRIIRKNAPGTGLFFVVEPYYGNIEISENKPYKEYFQRLSSLIPEDVYLTNAAWDRESQDSWKKTIRQPVFQWRNIGMDPWHIGRDFSTMPCFSVQTGYYPESDDVAFPNTHIGRGAPDIFPLMATEFMWNINSPGCFMLESDVSAKPEKQIETLYHYPIKKISGLSYSEWQWKKSATEPKEVAYNLLPRICEELFGKDAAPMMSEILCMGIARRMLLMSGPGYQSPQYYNTFHDPNVIKEQYTNAQKAVDMLSAFKQSGKDFKKLEGLLRDMTLAAIAGKSHYHLLMAEEYSKAKKIKEAEDELTLARENLKAAEKKLKSRDYAQLGNITKALDSLSFRIAILGKAREAKSSGIKVGIYNPNEVGGKVYGEIPIYSTLLNVEGISPEFISTLDNLFQYDCVIMPDCKKFGTKDQGSFFIIEKEVFNAEQKLRDYVMKDGKGILFYHDSVGLERSATGRPVFPELCSGAKRMNSTQVMINAEHPVSKGLKKGESFEHMYFDHIQMKPGETGTVVASDKKNAPVVIAGELGKGRVVLNGTIILKNNGDAIKEATGIDKDLLINSVFWLAGKK